ncbi:hypothetical protein SS1G_13917 [Sclerotinia sclerotiorum 1980 UF-70]|uniref:Rhodopsin domain-containing protein n=1 Tax=Sclerotinia sclerotiorum (strain ATCC 18683 / 1980 / Ss-1) TaxID=665079 RepID=A7F8I6_SCLS1|nr:hypothetical protein SS1G_13917 [Sclerotinia sclerotiorum 1980 UF-70]EDN99057.1 hypothetical protein SS1G_13917 [Sclerotinia sclerotiorum 1980 UF-70]
MPTTGLVVPPGQSPPFAVVTSTDHSAWVIIATALGLACVLVFGGIKTFARTSLGKGVSYDEMCLVASTFLRWQIISSFDIIFELAFVFLSVYLVWSLRTSKSNKTIVVVAFGFRLPMIIAISYRLATFDINGLTKNPMFLEDEFIIWTQTELNYSVISAIIPSLRPFVKNLSTYYGQELGGRSGYTLENSENYQLSNLGSVLRKDTQQQEGRVREDVDPDDYKFRIWANEEGRGPKKHKNIGEGSSRLWKESGGEAADGLSVGSSDSQRMIIKKDTTWTIQMD